MIYLDNAATTKPSKTALEKASLYNELFFNPSALYHGGIQNHKEISTAKDVLLRALGASNEFDVVFTSCGSEADNQAVFCAVKRGVFVTDKGEHSAVYKSFLELKNKGLTVEFIDLLPDGRVDEAKLYRFVKDNKVDFVSIVHVNNETGAINDINTIAKNLKTINHNLVFHSDGVQAFGKVDYRLSSYIDLYSISAHKINGLKGVGALIKKKKLNINPLIFGGGQENGLRSGTENLFGIKVFEYAVNERFSEFDKHFEKVKLLKDYVLKNLDKNIFKIISSECSTPYILAISCVGVRGEVVMHTLEGYDIVIGNGSACSSKNRFSRVIEACGYKNDVLDGMIRISFSPDNTLEEIMYFTDKLNETGKRLKGIMR